MSVHAKLAHNEHLTRRQFLHGEATLNIISRWKKKFDEFRR